MPKPCSLELRGRDRFTRDTPSLLTSVFLFDWDSGRQAWPPPRPSMAAAFAETFVPAYNSADWAQDNERRVAAQQRERPGRARFSTSPVPTMSPQSAQTIGMS